MGVPVGARSRFKGDVRTTHAGRIRRLEQRIDADGAGERLGRSPSGGREPLRLISMSFSRILLNDPNDPGTPRLLVIGRLNPAA
jgi:hypothetical protein